MNTATSTPTAIDTGSLELALKVIRGWINNVRPDDREDGIELLRSYVGAASIEDEQAALDAIREVFGDDRGRVLVMPTPSKSDQLEAWKSHMSARIRSLRGERGLTQAQLAEQAGLTQSHVSQVESGKTSPNALTIHKIAKALGVPPTTLDPNAGHGPTVDG
jgi:DNA-binding XRE family transcriptional regulator